MKFNRRLKPRVGLDMTPMIDVVFQLILFFLVSTTFAILPGIGLTLPASTTADGERTNGVTVTVAANGDIFVNADQVGLDGLDAALAALKAPSDRAAVPVNLESDESVPNGTVVRVLDSLRRSGFTGVRLRTRE